MMLSKSNFFIKASPLLLVLFIDGMGLGLVLPVLNGLLFDPESTFLKAGSLSPNLHNLVYGLIIGIFMLCWFFGAAILGDLSDQIGRKKALMICLLGASLSYFLSALSVLTHSLSLLIIGRIVAGFTSGSQPIAQAAIIDLSTPETKARNIGYILLSLSLGFIFGPLLGGILADPRIISWFDFATPFYFAASISLLNMIILGLGFNETFVHAHQSLEIKLSKAMTIFVSAFKHEKIKRLSFLFFVFIFGWSSFYSFIALYLLKQYHFSPTKVSIYMAVMGLGFAIGNGFLVNYIAKFFNLRTSYIFFTYASALIILLMLLIKPILFNWLAIAPMAAFISSAYACILTIFSNQVDEQSQGWVMGINGSIMAIVWAVNGVLVGILASLSAALPIYIACSTLALAGFLTQFILKENEDETNSVVINTKG